MRDTPCAARGAEPLAFLPVLGGGVLRGGWTSPLGWVAQDGKAGWSEGRCSFPTLEIRNACFSSSHEREIIDRFTSTKYVTIAYTVHLYLLEPT